MKKAQWSWLLSSHILLLFSTINNTVLVDGQCLNDQRRHLLNFKNSVNFDLEYSTKLSQWNPEDDCCNWRGVGCDASGRITSLELHRESITGGADNLTSLFRLQFLEKLNLGFNNFNYITIPKAIKNLTNLVYLNLSYSGFAGQVPIELSRLSRLVYLDLSTESIYGEQISSLAMEKPTLKMLIQNLSNIEEMHLDGVDLSAQRSDWSQTIATSLPKLRVLSLRECNIAGPIHLSLPNMPNLSDIILDNNNISAKVPGIFANMQNLRTLSLYFCNLVGHFPMKIFEVPTLQTIDVSYNKLLHGRLPPFPKNSSLTTIVLTCTSFSGSLSNSFGNLHMLSTLHIGGCNFSGTIPQFQSSNNLVSIDISNNSLTGSLSSTHFEGLKSLQTLNLGNNFLSGKLPSSLFRLPALRSIDISNNQFSGQIDEIPSGLSMSRMQVVALRSNHFNGSFPKFLFELQGLEELSLSFNSFSDTIPFETFKNLPNLTRLGLSYNNLTVEIESNDSSLVKIRWLALASCKLKTFPKMTSSTDLVYLDLSGNEISGDIPNWIWNLSFSYINLSLNSFAGLQQPYDIFTPGWSVLDLHSNLLKGDLPSLSSVLGYVDFSKNKFSGPIPSKLKSQFFMSLSDNSLTGSIPNTICSTFGPMILDLSNNSLIGTIPSCLVSSGTLEVLNLAGNNLDGSIPDTFPANSSLITLDLARNKFDGKLPRTFSNCIMLEVLNLGNNKIDDVFPCMFEYSSSLRVLSLRSNNFHGELECFGYNYSWPRLQIIDIASNNFSGVLASQFFSSLKNMLTLSTVDYLRLSLIATYVGNDYMYKAGVTMKGHERELEKISTIFTSIDFSNNKFSGKMPDSIGDLKGLYVLDLSHNELTGEIPSAIRKLRNLESLDLSMNLLAGEIPSTIQDLTFLTYLNLSFNTLSGKIPTGSQLQTFSNDSYIGNEGLCGFPLNVECGNASGSTSSLSNKEIDWMYICASAGYVVGLGIFSTLMLFCPGWRNKLFLQVDHLLVKVFGPKWKKPIRML